MSNPNREGRQCEGKQQHRTKQAAIDHKWAMVRRHGEGRYNVYRCPHCGYYHVGRTATPRFRQRRREWHLEWRGEW